MQAPLFSPRRRKSLGPVFSSVPWTHAKNQIKPPPLAPGGRSHFCFWAVFPHSRSPPVFKGLGRPRGVVLTPIWPTVAPESPSRPKEKKIEGPAEKTAPGEENCLPAAKGGAPQGPRPRGNSFPVFFPPRAPAKARFGGPRRPPGPRGPGKKPQATPKVPGQKALNGPPIKNEPGPPPPRGGGRPLRSPPPASPPLFFWCFPENFFPAQVPFSLAKSEKKAGERRRPAPPKTAPPQKKTVAGPPFRAREKAFQRGGGARAPPENPFSRAPPPPAPPPQKSGKRPAW